MVPLLVDWHRELLSWAGSRILSRKLYLATSEGAEIENVERSLGKRGGRCRTGKRLKRIPRPAARSSRGRVAGSLRHPKPRLPSGPLRTDM